MRDVPPEREQREDESQCEEAEAVAEEQFGSCRGSSFSKSGQR